MTKSYKDWLRRELSALVDRLDDDASEEALNQVLRVKALLDAAAAPASPSNVRDKWVALLSQIGITDVPMPVLPKRSRLPMRNDLVVFVPSAFNDPNVLEAAMREFGLRILNRHGAELDLANLESLCAHPGWVLIDETVLGGRPITDEQKVLRMDPLGHAPKHVPLMDLAAFLMYCAFRRATEKSLPQGKWTLGGTQWKEPRQTLRVECAPPATVIVSRESHHLKHGSRHAHE